MGKAARVLTAILLLLAAAAVLVIAGKEKRGGVTAADPLTVTILKVGKADAIILESAGKAVVIDAGEEDDGVEVVDFLKGRGISRVASLIITHFDRDHVGGADLLVESLPVEQVILPDYVGSGVEYLDFIAALDAAGITPVLLREPMSVSMGQASLTIEPPSSYEIPADVAEIDNDFSLMVTVTHGENRLLFAADAEKQRLRQWLSSDSAGAYDFLKVPHHGIYNALLPEFFQTVSPRYAVICCSEKNPADPDTLELLKVYGADVLQTRYGKVTVISDGVNLSVHQKIRH